MILIGFDNFVPSEENQGYNCGWSILRVYNQTQQLKDSTATPIFSRYI